MKRGFALFLFCFLCACAGGGSSVRDVSGRGLAKTQPDRDPVRRIILVEPRSRESVDVVYFRDGRYDPTAMKKIENIMRDRHDNKAGTIDPELIDYMVDMRKRLGLPQTIPFQILSGYRSRATNEKLAESNANVAKESLHLHGWAVDFRLDGVNGKAISEIAKTMQRGGVAYYPNDNHLHVDLGNIRTWQEKK